MNGRAVAGAGGDTRLPDPIRIQGWYYLATGLWPIVHLDSFQFVTGPKTDTWLVQTLGGVIGAIGAALISGGTDRSATVLATASAVVLAAADVWFVARGRIRPVYLADAVVELTLLAAIWSHQEAVGE